VFKKHPLFKYVSAKWQIQAIQRPFKLLPKGLSSSERTERVGVDRVQRHIIIIFKNLLRVATIPLNYYNYYEERVHSSERAKGARVSTIKNHIIIKFVETVPLNCFQEERVHSRKSAKGVRVGTVKNHIIVQFNER